MQWKRENLRLKKENDIKTILDKKLSISIYRIVLSAMSTGKYSSSSSFEINI